MEEEDREGWVFVRRRPYEWDCLGSIEDVPPDGSLQIRFVGPAEHWTDAAPVGNGRLGAMVWGGVATEKLQLNHDTLWTGIPGDYTNPQAPAVLSQVRKLVDDGQYVEATAAAFGLSDHPSDVYQPLGDIEIDFGDSHINYSGYERLLDLDTAKINVKYNIGDVEYTREHFASNPHQVFVTKITASKSGSLSFTISLNNKLHHQTSVNGSSQIVMKGSCRGKRIPPKGNVFDNPEGIQFTAVLNLRIGGDGAEIHVVDDSKLRVEDSDWALILLVASSSFDGPFTKPSDSRKDPTLECMNVLKSLENMSFSQLYTYHLDDYQNLFHRVFLKLSGSSKISCEEEKPALTSQIHATFRGPRRFASSIPDLSSEVTNDVLVSTAERVKSFKVDEDPSLVELLFQYGRYLLISSSRPGTQFANLQGIWNKDIEPAWDCAPHLNINLQMNYWPSLPCNLSECQDPLFDYISSLKINGSKTARVNYEASGWVVHQVSDIWAKTSPDRGDPVWALWPMGGAWLCTHLWEHYTFSLDKLFLQDRAYPLLEGCASFLLDWLIEGSDGYLETNPSTSPEHSFIAPNGKAASVSYSSTMDMSIIREVFTALVSAAEVLGISESNFVDRVKKAQSKLYPPKIARDGSIMEWAKDFEDPDVHHRHLSHLFGLFPGHSITIEKTPELCKAADYSLYKRGEEGPGWSTTWKIALWARLRNSEHAYQMVKHLFDLVDPAHEANFEGGLYSNLFTAHPPFQIDANFGFTAAIAEMLVQSTLKDLYLLPALPRDKWSNGCVRGLKARGGVTVSICWKEGKLDEARLSSNNKNSLIRLHYDGNVADVRLLSGSVYVFNERLKCLKTCSVGTDFS
ncbi:Alpha-L-fucosidase 2 [Acorus calamus]|uniref:Alpha-L-fucosidase 2 n=1 Tax=Acorus calamus TaxID=4465 RepID=A0AAV9FAW1_ACOCL|nr:Alpha-L-fucosidase 2 [Acorus calamus]